MYIFELGLCGNFNGVQKDDFKTGSGLIEGTAATFANTWKVMTTCPDVSNCHQDPCSMSVEKGHYISSGKRGMPKSGAPCLLVKRESFHPVMLKSTQARLHKDVLFSDTCTSVPKRENACVQACGLRYILWHVLLEVFCFRAGETSPVVRLNGTLSQALSPLSPTAILLLVTDKFSMDCQGNMEYFYSLNSCGTTCRSLSGYDHTCQVTHTPVDGCGCADGTYRNDKSECVPASSCPCYYNNQIVAPSQVINKDGTTCTCTYGKLECLGIPQNNCSAPMVFFNCSNAGPEAKGVECQKSCQMLNSDQCENMQCTSGCVCPIGQLADGKGGCVKEEDCPCVHNGVYYDPGKTVKDDCNTCTCTNRKFVCTNKTCPSSCTIYGDGHYMTFDGMRYSFSGGCEYMVAQDYCSTSGSFRIITENIPCGTTGTTCSKSVKVFLGNKEFILSDENIKVFSYENGTEIPYKIYTVGIYFVIEADNGLVLFWDKKTSLKIILNHLFKGKVCGLCGNYDGNGNNDFVTRGGEEVVDPLEFGNSWRLFSSCPKASIISSPCDMRPHRQAWAIKQCSIIKSDVFKLCHSSVDPAIYYDICLQDTCACDSGGDCECFCTAVAAYAAACSEKGACISWRTSTICPLCCDNYNFPDSRQWHYKPCGPLTCDTCGNFSGNCSNHTPVEGSLMYNKTDAGRCFNVYCGSNCTANMTAQPCPLSTSPSTTTPTTTSAPTHPVPEPPKNCSYLVPPRPVFVNDKPEIPAITFPEFTITSNGIEVAVNITAIQAQISFKGLYFSITLPISLFYNNTEGQCGVCDNIKTNDCRLPDGKIAPSCENMAGAWKVNNTHCPSVPPPTQPPSITTTTTTTVPRYSDICEIILSNVFKECHKIHPPEPFYKACKYDVSHMQNSTGCYSLEGYASVCADDSICVDWRNSTNGVCAYNCTGSKVYKACGPIVEETCNSMYNEKFEACESQVCRFKEGCFCPNGTILFNTATGICTPFCGCVGSDGLPKKPGDSWRMNCKDCNCSAESMGAVCEPVQCPAVKPCDKPGYENKTVDCCLECVCNTNLCPSPTTVTCKIGFEVVQNKIEGACCPTFSCKPKSVCVFNNTEYWPGVKISVGACEDCTCGSIVDQKTGLLTPDCSPVICNTTCSLGFTYDPSSVECCGTCQQTHCIYADQNGTDWTVEVGKNFTLPNEKCIHYYCSKNNDAFILVKSSTYCPAFNQADCVPGTETATPDGCCRTCEMQNLNCRVQRNNTYLEVNNCKSVHSVEITSCSGSCDTSSIYSMAANSMMHQCSCCQELRTSTKQVKMNCPGQQSTTYTYTYVEQCGCHVTECKDKKSSD
ncbi:hypothetical protein NFI96_013957 [Prochilodus magdalenae]|nr:hypothetical protein NFI96_013957 [Prochilodus magdalenae]